MTSGDRNDPFRPPSPDRASAHEEADGSELDAVFGETAFRDYSDEPVFAVPPLPRRTDREKQSKQNPPHQKQPDQYQAQQYQAQQNQAQQNQRPLHQPQLQKQAGATLPRTQRILLWVAGGLVAVLAVVGLYALGSRLADDQQQPVAIVTPSETPTASQAPAPTAPVAGPLPVGSYDWTELLGGECIDPYTDAWAEEFTVVDCAAPHPAQLVDRGTFPVDAANPAYPGVDALQAQINLLCTAPTVVDFAAAGQFADIQVQASFAATAEEWDAGQHDYFCFVTRSSGEPLTVSVAVPAV